MRKYAVARRRERLFIDCKTPQKWLSCRRNATKRRYFTLEEEMITEKENVLTASISQKRAEEVLTRKKDSQLQQLEATIPSTWKLSKKGMDAVRTSMTMMSTTHGLYASIPMMCKGEECIYATLFPELHEGLDAEGERCPVEIALILTKYDAYVKELNIEPEDAVDISILRDVIDYEVQIMRAENKMAIEGDFVKEVIVSVQENGTPIMQEQITKSAEYKDKMQVKRNRALELLNSTRKDKAGTKLTMVMDPSTYARDLLKRASVESQTIEGNFEDLEVIPDIYPVDKS